MRNPRRVLSKAQILDRVWQYDFGGQANVVELYVSYLRTQDRQGPRRRCSTRCAASGYVLKPALSDRTAVALDAAPAARRRRWSLVAVVAARHGRPSSALALQQVARRASVDEQLHAAAHRPRDVAADHASRHRVHRPSSRRPPARRPGASCPARPPARSPWTRAAGSTRRTRRRPSGRLRRRRRAPRPHLDDEQVARCSPCRAVDGARPAPRRRSAASATTARSRRRPRTAATVVDRPADGTR